MAPTFDDAEDEYQPDLNLGAPRPPMLLWRVGGSKDEPAIRLVAGGQIYNGLRWNVLDASWRTTLKVTAAGIAGEKTLPATAIIRSLVHNGMYGLRVEEFVPKGHRVAE
eukprot:3413254-Rhodomonas_salina.1